MRKLALIAEEVITVFKNRDGVLAKKDIEMLNAENSKLLASGLDHLLEKCKDK